MEQTLVEPASARWYTTFNPPLGTRQFMESDLETITNGTYHCTPAALATIMEFHARTGGFTSIGMSGLSQAAYIDEIARFLDTNDQNPMLLSGDREGHFGTFNSNIVPGATEFVKQRDSTLSVLAGFGPFDLSNYVMAITLGQPVLVIASNSGLIVQHAYVGYGYVIDDQTADILNLIVMDTWKGVDRTIKVPTAADELAIASVAGRTNPLGDISIADEQAPLENAIMFTFDIARAPTPVDAPTPARLMVAALTLMVLLGTVREAFEDESL